MHTNMYNHDLLYSIFPEDHELSRMLAILEKHKNIRFASFISIGLTGECITETIPIEEFITLARHFPDMDPEDEEGYYISFQTGLNGSKSGILTVRPDFEVVWFVDYNFRDLLNPSATPMGTLMIPSFLIENKKKNCARYIMQKAVDAFADETYRVLSQTPELRKDLPFDPEDLCSVFLISSMEVCFWVYLTRRSEILTRFTDHRFAGTDTGYPIDVNYNAAIEQALFLLEHYGFRPRLVRDSGESRTIVLEEFNREPVVADRLKLKWSYENPLYTADAEFFVRYCLEKSFYEHGLSISFSSRYIDELAVNNEYYYIDIKAVLKTGELSNLLIVPDNDKTGPGLIGLSFIYGLLKNPSIIAPFLTSRNNNFHKYSKTPLSQMTAWFAGGQAPTDDGQAVSYLMHPSAPENARLIMQLPHLFANSHLSLAAITLCMLDGFRYMTSHLSEGRHIASVLRSSFAPEISNWEEAHRHLLQNDIFSTFSRANIFLQRIDPPRTVYESFRTFLYAEQLLDILCFHNVFSEANIAVFTQSMLMQWQDDLASHILPAALQLVRNIKMSHEPEDSYDDAIWKDIQTLRNRLAKDTKDRVSIFTEIRLAIDSRNFKELSRLQVSMEKLVDELRIRYQEDSQNMI